MNVSTLHVPIVDHVAADAASLIGWITGCLLARETFNWTPETILPAIWENDQGWILLSHLHKYWYRMVQYIYGRFKLLQFCVYITTNFGNKWKFKVIAGLTNKIVIWSRKGGDKIIKQKYTLLYNILCLNASTIPIYVKISYINWHHCK